MQYNGLGESTVSTERKLQSFDPWNLIQIMLAKGSPVTCFSPPSPRSVSFFRTRTCLLFLRFVHQKGLFHPAAGSSWQRFAEYARRYGLAMKPVDTTTLIHT